MVNFFTASALTTPIKFGETLYETIPSQAT
nr:MAG TPA: hypothetical protein [Caudoviricetes sp.]